MNQLTRFLLKETLGEQKIIAIYGGGFKPPTKGHFNVVKQTLEQFPEIDELKIFVGSGVRDGITQDESIKIWNIYKNYLSDKVDVEPSIAPVKSVLDYSKEHPDEKVYWILGARECEENDFNDIACRTRSVSKYPNIEVKVITSSGGVSGTKTRQAIKNNNKEQFFHLIPDIKEKEQVWNIVSPAIKEGRKKKPEPEKGTGKKPKGSSRRLYTDEDPKDTVGISFKTKEDIVDTLNKASFKAKSHARQSQIINVIHQRVRAAYNKAKDPEVKARLKRGLDYIEKRKETSKEKTKRLNKMKEASDPQAGTALPYSSGFAPVNEGRYDSLTREIVKDIIYNWKKKYKGIPKNLKYNKIYDTTNSKGVPLTFELDAILSVKETRGKEYDIDGGGYPYDNPPAIEIRFQVDPRDLPQKWETIYNDLINVVRHEVEHLTQQGYNVISSKEMEDDEELRDTLDSDADYFKLPQEVDAMLQGMYLKAKKTRTPFKQVITDYFNELGLTNKEQKDILKVWKQRAKALSLPLNEDKTDYFGLNEYTKTFVNEIFNNQESDNDFKTHLKSLIQYMIKSGLNIKPLPKINIISNDKQNASNILGNTAYYNPEDKSITLFTMNRHPKDVLRSFSHEMIHHIQNLENRLNNITTQNTNEDGDLPEIEREAYEKGNMIFRNWEDSVKSKKYLKEYKQYVLNELFEKDLPNIEKISPFRYIVGNGKDIEAEYYFRRIDIDNNTWVIGWSFTENNKNTSPEAWKQVTATSFKILNNFIQEKKPKSIEISGNTNAKTNIYKSKSFLEKLENLFNNQYRIDNSDEDKVVMNLIENIRQSSIKKRMETLNESYEQALNYWQNGDIKSKSKIERWDSIKKKIKREVLQEIYKFKLNINYKQLKEEETATPEQQYKIYCDMDGVLADFDKRFKDLNPEHLTAAEYQTKYGIEKFWNFIDEENKVKFWVGIPWMSDGKQLWDYIKDKNPTLLSAPSRKPSSRLGKRLWIKNNLPGTPLILAAADKKQNYSQKDAILIDDRPDNVEQWRSKGGIGILHTNTENTIKQLQKYGI